MTVSTTSYVTTYSMPQTNPLDPTDVVNVPTTAGFPDLASCITFTQSLPGTAVIGTACQAQTNSVNTDAGSLAGQ